MYSYSFVYRVTNKRIIFLKNNSFRKKTIFDDDKPLPGLEDDRQDVDSDIFKTLKGAFKDKGYAKRM